MAVPLVSYLKEKGRDLMNTPVETTSLDELEAEIDKRIAAQEAKDAREARPICQYCLADGRYTKIADNKDRRCPVCGADYTGPRRSREYAVIREAGLLWDPPRPAAAFPGRASA
jgi:tRNA(Ile2) C34 agmatinyltransferase TiaS